MPWQKVWRIPTEIDRQGLLDPALLASKSETELIGLLDGLAVHPRYGQGARTLSDAARLVWERFGGDAGAIWKDASPAEVEKTLQEIHGLGAGIASMATRILRDDFGCFRGQEWQIDVKPDVHLVRVFRRIGIIDGDSANEVIWAARRLSPEFPGELDWPAWRIGQQWCHPTEPDCARCPLTGDCAKRM
jgi:endonuclease III